MLVLVAISSHWVDESRAQEELTTKKIAAAGVGGEFVGIRHRSIFGSREPGVPREVVAMA